jgi:hypothetical protein
MRHTYMNVVLSVATATVRQYRICIHTGAQYNCRPSLPKKKRSERLRPNFKNLISVSNGVFGMANADADTDTSLEKEDGRGGGGTG